MAAKSKDKEAKVILDKINNEKRLKYVYDRKRIRELLTKAKNEKRKVKIKYYSPHSDAHTTRIIDIYQVYINDFSNMYTFRMRQLIHCSQILCSFRF